MRKFGITFWFYAGEHFKKKALIVYALFLVATIGGMFAINHFGGGGYNDVAIVVNSNTFVIHEEMLQDIPQRDFVFIDSEAEATSLLEEGDIVDIFIIEGDVQPVIRSVGSHSTLDTRVQSVLFQFLTIQYIELMTLQYELPASAVEALMTPIETHFEVFGEDEVSTNTIAADIMNGIFPWIIYMLVLMSGQVVANAVAVEKTGRVMEVMLAKVHPTTSMLAKVLSSFVGVVMPILMIIIGVIASEILGFIELDALIDLISEFIPFSAIILAVVVLFLGYFCFVFLYAAAGALATSIESLQTVLSPLVYAVMIPTFLPMFLSLDHLVMDILVYVPFASPFIIVQRHLRGYSPIWEVALSLALMAIFALVALGVSARIYMNGVSHNSEKVTLKDLKKLLQK